MKLRKSNELPQCCRWCHYYSLGVCYCKENKVDLNDDFSIYQVAEDGTLDECLGEVLESKNNEEFRPVEMKLQELGISQKRIGIITDVVKECIEDYKEAIRPLLDEKVSICYQNYEPKENEGVPISNPESFCCNNWR